MHNVKNFGARGDNAAHDTPAVQRAIDAGGEVFFPAGKYVVGTLRLHGGTVLRFAPGAELIADPCPDYWYIIDKDPESRYNASGNAYAYSDSAEGDPRDQYAMLHAYESENVRISMSKIDVSEYTEEEMKKVAASIGEERLQKLLAPVENVLQLHNCRGVDTSGCEIYRV